MALESRLDLRISQKLVLTPQIQMAIKLLQMPQLELVSALNQELMENPFLEDSVESSAVDDGSHEEMSTPLSVDDPEVPLENLTNFCVDEYFEERSSDGRDLGYFNHGNEEQPSYELFYTKKPDLCAHLLWQLRLCSADDEIRKVAEVVIANMDEDGYIRSTEEELAELSGTDATLIEKAVDLVQGFDPPGIGARDLKECLLLQLSALDLRGTLVEKIVCHNLEELQKKKYSSIAKQHNSSLDDVMAAVKIVEGLEPRPGRIFFSGEINYVVPDVFINRTEDGYQIILNEDGLPRLILNNSYRNLLLKKDMLSKEEREFLKDKLRTATELIKSLDQRNKTIYKVSDSILKFQQDFFDKGINYLKPLNLKDVAADINMHESTISRVTSTKFLACDHGVFSFKFFFCSAIRSSDQGTVASTSVKDLIKKLIAEEDPVRPLSDQMIAEKLKEYNITIARRTVAKYREELKSPPQNLRRRR